MARLVRQFIGNIVKDMSIDDPYVLQILDPWSLMYGEYEDDFIEMLRQRIGPKHPLHSREVYAVAIRRDPDATLFHAYNDGFYAIVYFSAMPRGRSGMPKTEIFPTDRAVGEKIAADHAERLEQYKRGQAN
jgi:hypothetical protein